MSQTENPIAATGNINTVITNRQNRIFMVEDSDADAELILYEMKRGGFQFILKRVITFEDFKRELEEFVPHLVLCDYNLPNYNALDVLDVIRKRHPEIPTIVVTGAIGDELAAETIKRGAVDYLLKDRMERLRFAILKSLTEAENVRLRRSLKEKINQLNSEKPLPDDKEASFQKMIKNLEEISYCLEEVNERSNDGPHLGANKTD